MIDFATEDLITFGQAAEMLPGRSDRRTSPSTIWRWAKVGCKASDGTLVKLETVRIGGRFCTSREAVLRFIAATNDQAEASPAAPIRTPAQRKRSSQRAAEKLAKARI